VLKLVRAGYFRPVVSSVFPLKDAARAQEQMENREQFGKIVLAVDSN
jgi:NADPH:quinone reductase-like Zn-dependent oxidoreductase